MSESIALAGHIGTPTELGVPPRSMKRIQRAIFETDERYHYVERTINFQAIETATGDHITELRVITIRVNGRPVNEAIAIVYRNGRFKVASAEYEDGKVVEHTLTGAIERITHPIEVA